METSIQVETMTDGSKVYNVVFTDGSLKASIAAVDEAAAKWIQDCLKDSAAYATID